MGRREECFKWCRCLRLGCIKSKRITATALGTVSLIGTELLVLAVIPESFPYWGRLDRSTGSWLLFLLVLFASNVVICLALTSVWYASKATWVVACKIWRCCCLDIIYDSKRVEVDGMESMLHRTDAAADDDTEMPRIITLDRSDDDDPTNYLRPTIAAAAAAGAEKKRGNRQIGKI